MSDNVRFHSKHHGKAHHTTASPGYHDSAVDPIASSASPFMGNFNLSGSHVYYDTSVAADTSRTIGYTDFVDKYDPMYTTVRTQSSSWIVLSGDYWSVTSGTQHPNDLTNKVGIGTNAADEMLTVAGTISAYGSLKLRGLGSNQFFKLEGGTNTLGVKQWDGTNIMAFNGSTNSVGIGTSVPDSFLHIALSDNTTNITSQFGEGIVVQNTDTTNNNFTSIQFKGGDSIMAQVGAQFVDHSNNAGELFFTTRDSSGSRTEKMRIDKDGNVGIGTTGPSEELHVVSDSTGTIRLDGSVVQLEIQSQADSRATVATLTNHPLRFSTHNTERMTILGTGNVGIGHTTPGQSLTVVGSVSADSYKFPDGTEQTTAGNTDPIMVSLTEEDLYAQVGSRKLTFVAPYAFTLSKIRAVVSDPPTGSSLSLSAISTGGPLHSGTVDVAAGAYYGDKSSGLLNTSLADGETIWIDLSAVGSTNAGKGVKIYFYR